MEKSQSEVTNKIRSAIKKKLAEISDFVDDELPEYIMILIANQRSKTQIEKDLSLFLRSDTVNFTNWLWDLLNNLKGDTKSDNPSPPKSDLNFSKKKDIDIDEDAIVLDFDPEERETDFLSHEDSNDSFNSKSTTQLTSGLGDEKVQDSSVAKSVPNDKRTEKIRNESKLSMKVNKIIPSQSFKEPLSSAVIPVKKRMTDSEDEYDPAKPEYERPIYSSGSRKYGGSAALQANKLLLKAVDDATKSILTGKNIEDYYKPTPIEVLTSKRYRNPLSRRDDNLRRKKNPLQEMLSHPELSSELPVVSEFQATDYPTDIIMEEDINFPVTSHRSRTICLKPIPLISNSPEYTQLEGLEYTQGSNDSYSFATAVDEIRPKSPHFIVTLDGVSRTSLKRKLEDNNSVDSMDEDEDNLNDEVVMPEKKQKLNERCKYWPACKNSDQCPYHHPTVPCKCFPDCKFGDKCLYIHPNCKFDALCSRKDCPFTHASKRKLPFIALPLRMIPVKSRKVKTVCKFYPNCTSKNCPFIHPKLCRYGTDCRLPACVFSHFPIPSRSQLKWQAAMS